MRILVTGSRYHPYSLADLSAMELFARNVGFCLLERDLWDAEHGMPIGDLKVVVGDNHRGLDLIARDWCHNSLVPFEEYEADWELYGRGAGPKRNQAMVDSGADVCLAFPLADSRGTLDCMGRAYNAGIPVWCCTKEGTTRWTP